MKRFLALALLVVVSGVSAADSNCPKSCWKTYVCEPTTKLGSDSLDFAKQHPVMATVNTSALALLVYQNRAAIVSLVTSLLAKKA